MGMDKSTEVIRSLFETVEGLVFDGSEKMFDPKSRDAGVRGLLAFRLVEGKLFTYLYYIKPESRVEVVESSPVPENGILGQDLSSREFSQLRGEEREFVEKMRDVYDGGKFSFPTLHDYWHHGRD